MKRHILVETHVTISVDETKFTDEFMKEFREDFYDFSTIDQHIKHLAWLYATGKITGYFDEFVEGYGKLSDFGVEFEPIEWDDNDVDFELWDER